MNTLMIQGAALVLMLLALPLASLGTSQGMAWANYAGLAAITLGGLMMPILHFVDDDDDADAKDEEENA